MRERRGRGCWSRGAGQGWGAALPREPERPAGHRAARAAAGCKNNQGVMSTRRRSQPAGQEGGAHLRAPCGGRAARTAGGLGLGTHTHVHAAQGRAGEQRPDSARRGHGDLGAVSSGEWPCRWCRQLVGAWGAPQAAGGGGTLSRRVCRASGCSQEAPTHLTDWKAVHSACWGTWRARWSAGAHRAWVSGPPTPQPPPVHHGPDKHWPRTHRPWEQS